MTVHVSRDGHVIGEFTQQIFKNLLESGHLHPTDHFWVDGMAEWKPVTVARSFFGQREKCRHCGGKMTENKPVTEGPRQGQTRSICLRCGHIEHHATA